MNNDFTICIKSFERPSSLEVCIKSFRKYYDVPIIVADDSISNARNKIINICQKNDCKLIILEPDSGVAIGRNILMNAVQTPYIFQTDDDIVCDQKLKIRRLYNQIVYEDFDIVSPILKMNRKIIDFYACHYEKEDNILWCKYGANNDGQYHFVSNTWFGKTDVVKNIQWNEELKVGGQHDWFLKCWLKNLKIGINKHVVLIDTHNQLNPLYKKMRNRLSYNNNCMMDWSKKLGLTLRFINKDGKYDEWSDNQYKIIDLPSDQNITYNNNIQDLISKIDYAKAFEPNLQYRFISTEELILNTKRLISQISPNITGIIGIARSGILPASILSYMLHLPLYIMRSSHGDLIETGNGWRLKEGAPKEHDMMLVVDDTTMTGGSIVLARNRLKDIPNRIHASIYCNPNATYKPDIWVSDLPWPHLLEWNLFNSILLDAIITDFDGILCEDCHIEDDDDGPRYIEFLKNAKPKYLIRKRPIKLIVTARIEKYRDLTMDWLDQWGIRVDRLEMRENRRQNIIEFKSKHFIEFLNDKSNNKINPKMFIESDPQQSIKIAQLTGGLVVCPTNKMCYKYDSINSI